jgi:hypothetical protein
MEWHPQPSGTLTADRWVKGMDERFRDHGNIAVSIGISVVATPTVAAQQFNSSSKPNGTGTNHEDTTRCGDGRHGQDTGFC